MSGQLAGRVALVAGGSAGIGRAIVERFMREGARVASADLDPYPADAQGPERPLDLRCDTGDARAVQSAVAEVAERLGPITVLVNGVATRTPVAALPELSDADWDEALRVNLTGSFLVAKAVIPHMRAAGGGSIVTIASEIGIVGSRGRAAYGATKAALIQMCRVMALDHAADGIRVNALSPGAVPSPRLLARFGSAEAADRALAHLYPMGRIGRAEEIAAAALFLASDESSFMTGANLVVDGGYTAQ